MNKITYANKVAINENAEIPNINKITDDDMNEIKTVVNNNDDELITINTKLTNATTYSTDETVVGTWIDNKPIYRKVYKITDNPPSTSYNLNISNLDVVTKFEFIADYQLNDYRYRRGNTYLSNIDYINTFIRDNAIQIRIGEIYSNITNLYGIYFIIEYTKTND